MRKTNAWERATRVRVLECMRVRKANAWARATCVRVLECMRTFALREDVITSEPKEARHRQEGARRKHGAGRRV